MVFLSGLVEPSVWPTTLSHTSFASLEAARGSGIPVGVAVAVLIATPVHTVGFEP